MKKFMVQIDEQCFNRRVNLTKMFLGTSTAKLLSRLLMHDEIDITHLKMPYNNLGDEGMSALSHAISANKSIVYVDLRQNSITPRCARALYIMLAKNVSIVTLKLGSLAGSQRNRIGTDGCSGLANAFRRNQCLIQYLDLKASSITSAGVMGLVEALKHYLYLRTLDLS